MLTLVIRGLSLPEGGRVLEIGAACGKYAVELCLRGYEYLGFDMVPEAVDSWNIVSSFYGIRDEIRVQDICELREIAAEWDGILAVSTFEHIHDRPRALRNCYELLRPGGRLVILDGNILDPRHLWRMLVVQPIRFKGRSGGLKWLLNRTKVYASYGMGWKGKDEDVKSVYWWRRELPRYGFHIVEATTSGAYDRWIRRLGLWPLVGRVYLVAKRPTQNSRASPTESAG